MAWRAHVERTYVGSRFIQQYSNAGLLEWDAFGGSRDRNYALILIPSLSVRARGFDAHPLEIRRQGDPSEYGAVGKEVEGPSRFLQWEYLLQDRCHLAIGGQRDYLLQGSPGHS